MCEFCDADGGPCVVCGGCDHDAPRRRYAAAVAAVCLVGVVVFVTVAGVCAVVNLFATR